MPGVRQQHGLSAVGWHGVLAAGCVGPGRRVKCFLMRLRVVATEHGVDFEEIGFAGCVQGCSSQGQLREVPAVHKVPAHGLPVLCCTVDASARLC